MRSRAPRRGCASWCWRRSRGPPAIRPAATAARSTAAPTTHPAPSRPATHAGARIEYGAEVTTIGRRPGRVAVRTASGTVHRARALVNCAGLHCDRIARLAGDAPGMRIVPFRGEYFTLAPERAHLVRGL